MPAFASIVLNDGQATPVAHTFYPQSLDQSKNLAVYADRISGIPLGYPTLMLSLTQPTLPAPRLSSTADRVFKVRFSMILPLLETLGNTDAGFTPPPTVAATCRFNQEFIFPERCSLQNRKDMLAYAANLLAATHPSQMVQNLDTIY
jgi:hypothetical protein